jgi:hypothetical protein
VCGAAYGESNRCPHCHAVAGSEPSAALGARCRVCGGPRIPTTDPAIVRTGREIALLKRVERSRIAASAWRAGAWITGLFGAASVMIAAAVLALVHPAALPSVIALLLASIPLVVAFPAAARANKLRRERRELLDKAWALVASDIVAQREGAVSSTELATGLSIDEARAESLLAQLSVENLVTAHVTREGELVYGASNPARIRIEAGHTGADAPSKEESRTESEHAADRARAENPK